MLVRGAQGIVSWVSWVCSVQVMPSMVAADWNVSCLLLREDVYVQCVSHPKKSKKHAAWLFPSNTCSIYIYILEVCYMFLLQHI